MTTKHRIVSVLLRVYPASWRREYGAELEHVLLDAPLGPAAVADVCWNGFRQRLRVAEPAAIVGLFLMVVVSGVLASNLMSSSAPGDILRGVLEPTNITWPTVVVSLLNPRNELYVLLILACGCWTSLKYGGRIGRAATAGAVMTLLGSLPVMLAGAAMLAAGTADPRRAVGALVEPLFALPYAAVWGAVGGQLGRRIAYVVRRYVRS